jgi:RnfABCDGE-type electron transport complex B subunit
MTFSYFVCSISYVGLVAAAAPEGGIDKIIWAGATMVGLGSGFALVLLIASEKLKVEVDPKIEQIHEVLPNLDCGACGYAGCGQYAKAVLADPELIGKCAPGGADTSASIAEILNLQVSESGPSKRPVQGIPSCTAANALANVQSCVFGCLGLGDCRRACKFDALHVVDGVATVDYEKCTGCTACSKACPRNLIEMVPFGHENMITVACSSKETGKSTRSICKVGCIGCKVCTKQSDLFAVEDNLARLDYEKYEPSEQTELAMTKCPTKVIIYRGKSAPQGAQPAAKAATA